MPAVALIITLEITFQQIFQESASTYAYITSVENYDAN